MLEKLEVLQSGITDGAVLSLSMIFKYTRELKVTL